MSGILNRLALAAPVPVFAVAGAGAREAVQDLRLRDGIRVLDSPRAANVLLVAGQVPDELQEPLARVHDAMAHPRCTVFWSLGDDPTITPPALLDPIVVQDKPVESVRMAHRDLLTGSRVSDSPTLPDEDPSPWRGIGPYGQGGSGMTGGTPYGRPMAELAPDRDGLRLDLLPLAVGPFFARFPPGLSLDLKLAGDVLVEAAVRANPYRDQVAHVSWRRSGLSPFFRALFEPVSLAELELARARAHLRWLADALMTHELHALGLRTLRLAGQVHPGDTEAVHRLTRMIELTQVLRWSTRQVGVIAGDDLAGLGVGPVARASGLAEDLRTDDPAYRALGFEPIVQSEGDAAARWRQRLAEAAQSLELARRAKGRTSEPTGRVESSRGRLEPPYSPSERLMTLLPQVLDGLEWGDGVTTLVSLDIDLEEAALAESVTAAEAAR